MNTSADASSSRDVSRRQFGMAIGGGAFLLAIGGTYGVVTTGDHAARTSVGTAFGRISVLRAGRFSRLDAHGRAATTNLLMARPAAGGHEGSRRGSAGDPPGTGDAHGHGDSRQGSGWPQPVNLTWGDVLVLEAELYNASRDPVLFSPAQLRLKLTGSGTTITPQDSDHGPGVLAAGIRERVLISYLAPHSFAGLELEFSDMVQDDPLRLALPPLADSRALS